MTKKILILFLLLFAFVNAKVIVVQSRNSKLPFAEGMVVRLNGLTETKRYGVEDKNGLFQIAATNPDLLVIISTVTAENYVKLIREGEILPPHITIPDTPLREEDAAILTKHGIICIPTVSPTPIIRRLAEKLNLNSQQGIGYIYSDSSKYNARNEMSLLKSENIPVFSRLLRTPIISDEFAYGIGRFYTNNVLFYRLCGQDPILSFLENEPSMVSFVERRAAAVIVDSREYMELFLQTPVVLFTNNDALMERVSTIIVMATLRDIEAGNKPRFLHPIRIYSTSATLFNGQNSKGENLVEGTDLFLAQIDKITQQIKNRSQSANELWNLYSSTLAAIIDTSVLADKNALVVSSRTEMIDKFDRAIGTREFGYAALVIIVLILFIMICVTLFRVYRRKLYKRRVALIVPGAMNKTSFVSADGKSVPLSVLLENEGYQAKFASSLKSFHRIMRKNFPSIIIADCSNWAAARDTLRVFYQVFTNSHKYTQVGIILVNIPVNKQTQIKKILEGAMVYCYEYLPTLDDIKVHLRGDKHFSSYSEGSYMSGIIQEDNLTTVLQMIEGNTHTGCLVVEEDNPVSVIYFKSGRVVFAVDRSGESGVKAIYNALNCRRGNFYFHLNRTAQAETLNLGTMEILMGWAEQKDRFSKKLNAINDL